MTIERTKRRGGTGRPQASRSAAATCGVWFGLLFALAAPPVSAQIQLSFTPASVTVAPGGSALVALNAATLPSPGLAALQVALQYDPLVANLLNPNEAFRGTVLPFIPLGGDALCTTVRGTPSCDDPDWLLLATGRTGVAAPDLIDNTAGSIEFVFGSWGMPAPPETAGAIAYIEVLGVVDGTTSVTISAATLVDNQDFPASLAYVTASLPITVMTASVDTDGDGVADSVDNCTLVANANQRDTNGDGFGNQCDADINNNNFIDFLDLGLLKQSFFANPAAPNWNEDIDFDGNNFIDFVDLGIMKGSFFQPPGPSGLVP